MLKLRCAVTSLLTSMIIVTILASIRRRRRRGRCSQTFDDLDDMCGEVTGEDDESTVVSSVGDDPEAFEGGEDDSLNNSTYATEDKPYSSTYKQLIEDLFHDLLDDKHIKAGGDDDGDRVQRDGTQHLNSPHRGPLDNGESSKSDGESGGILTSGSESEAGEEFESEEAEGILILPAVPNYIYLSNLDDRLDTGVRPPVGETCDSQQGLGVNEQVRSEGAVSCDPSPNADDAEDIERSFEMVERVLDRHLRELNSESRALDDRVRAVETRRDRGSSH
mmetsp:Transcript_6363/g.14354  ORF Transcript_6363/g.14354 Transcript_6363/m.14354 type:complete len:277 (+) Transcript_6363:567-1397(+)